MPSNWILLRGKLDKLLEEIHTTKHPLPSREMCELLIVGEDHRFSRHCGVDVWALLRALFCTVVLASPQGGSTIAMQLVRTLTRRYERSLSRKLLEIVLAVRLTHYVGRGQVPTMYLWVAYYGWKMNNFRQACNRLGVEALSNDRYSQSRLVARLKYPEPCFKNVHRLNLIQQRGRYLIRLHDRSKKGYQNPKWNHFECQASLRS